MCCAESKKERKQIRVKTGTKLFVLTSSHQIELIKLIQLIHND